MSEMQTVELRRSHLTGCPCLECADEREAKRERGVIVASALDWRGELLPGRKP